MKVRVRDIEREGSVELEEAIPAGRLPIDTPDQSRLEGPVQAKMKAEIQNGAVWAWVQAKAKMSVACARCLERYSFEARPTFDVEALLTEEFLDVDDDVRQHLLLSLPPKPLCSAACKGLCARCGKNLNKGPCGCPPENIASAFDVLKNLKLKQG
jgi:uncharacterized protein